MLLKLPIVLDNKVVFTLFKLIKHDTYYLLSLFDNINNNDINCDVLSDKNCINKSDGSMIKIILSNNISGYEFYNIYVPLKLFIVDNKIISIYFFIISFLSLDKNSFNNNFDFFFYLNNFLKKQNLEFIQQKDYLQNQNKIFNIINSEYLLLNNNKKYNKEFWESINLLLNSSLFILWLNIKKITNIKVSKKIITITNIIKNIKYSIDYSSQYTFDNHILYKHNNELTLYDLLINNYYYLLID